MLLQARTERSVPPLVDDDNRLSIAPINNSHTSEVLAFLNERPLYTVVMSGLIRDNGPESPLNRGTFCFGTITRTKANHCVSAAANSSTSCNIRQVCLMECPICARQRSGISMP